MSDAAAQEGVVIYTTRLCGFCHAAKRLLTDKNIAFNEIPADGNQTLRDELVQRTGQQTVPQIWIGSEHVGGFTELLALERSGKLNSMLAAL